LSQQTSPPSRLRKDFLVVGLVLLILGFFSFYWASRVNWDYVSTYEETVNVGYPTYINQYGDYDYPVNLPTIEMQSGDYLTVECSQFAPLKSSFIILFEKAYVPFALVTPTEVGIYPDSLSYTNLDATEVISIDIGIPSNQNVTSTTVSVTLNLNHYETPQWVYFGIGVVLCSLAMTPIFKSNSKPKPISTEGSSQVEREYERKSSS
jgi:hypothetical protein